APSVAFRQIQEPRISRPRSPSPNLLWQGLCLLPRPPIRFHRGGFPDLLPVFGVPLLGFIGDASRKHWVQTSFCLGRALREGPGLSARPPRGRGRRGRGGEEPAGPESALFRRPGPRTVSVTALDRRGVGAGFSWTRARPYYPFAGRRPRADLLRRPEAAPRGWIPRWRLWILALGTRARRWPSPLCGRARSSTCL
uniref:Uncharacterized protein n=1 Tax=Mustela putorius furo TaxID=9669 RepID=M3YE72_MUSPF